MSLNKKTFIPFIILLLFSLNSCSSKKKESEEQQAIKKYNDPAYVLSQTQKVLGDNVKFAYKGKFDRDTVLEVAAGTEIKNSDRWGIRFYLLKFKDGELEKTFQTDLRNGSFNGCLVKKIKFPFFNHELIYYNSQDFFLGSAGGEIYSYLINFNKKETYYAHLIIEQNKPVSLYLSSNIKVPELRSFFIGNFKRDYPAVQLVSKDISLQN